MPSVSAKATKSPGEPNSAARSASGRIKAS